MSTTNQNSASTSPATVSVPPVKSDATSHRFAATEAQLEVWLSSQSSEASNCAYNELASLVFRGELNTGFLKLAIEKVVMRNAALRSTFSADGQEVIVHDEPNFEFEAHDWIKNDRRVIPELERQVVNRLADTPFDLENGPLLRVVMQRIDAKLHKLTFAAHHSVLDGWSLAVLCRDLGHFYDELCGRDVEPLPPADKYSAYATAMDAYFKSDEGQADEAFWVSQFSDSIPVLDLPTEHRRPNVRDYAAGRYDYELPANLVDKVRKVGAKQGCSLFNAMLSGFNAYVARLSGNDDFCVGIPTAGQAAMDQTELIGHCVNTLPFRTKVDTAESFQDYMKQVRSELLDALDHQRYSFGTLLRKLAPPRDPSRPPMVSISFNVDPMIDTSEMGFEGLDVDVVIEARNFENFDMAVNGVIQKDQSVQLQVQYNSDLYSTDSIQFYFEGFAAFLEGMAAAPSSPIVELPVMTIPQRQQVWSTGMTHSWITRWTRRSVLNSVDKLQRLRTKLPSSSAMNR